MAKRYRYAFAKKKEARKGIWSTILAALSFILFFAAVFVSFLVDKKYAHVAGGLCLFAALLSIYGFGLGLKSFSEEKCTHRTSIIGSIANGVFMVAWLGFYLIGL